VHPEAYDFVERITKVVDPTQNEIIEFGSRDLNGSVRPLFIGSSYVGMDKTPGKGVNFVEDVCDVQFGPVWDIVICTEMLEHCDRPARVISQARRALRESGLFICTCASDKREPHCGNEAKEALDPGEFYRGITLQWMESALSVFDHHYCTVARDGLDIYAVAAVNPAPYWARLIDALQESVPVS
jgi:SAM-dependent methyltransferase